VTGSYSYPLTIVIFYILVYVPSVYLFVYLFIYYMVYTHVKSFTIAKNRSYQYYVACSKILAQLQCKDLGIIVTHDLSPQQNINEIVIKAHRRANCILRCFMSRDNDLFVRAFVAYVHLILECNSNQCLVGKSSA